MSGRLSLLQIADVRWWNAGAHYAVTLAAALARRGHEVVLAGLPSSPPVLASEARGIRTEAIPGLDGSDPVRFPAAVASLARLVARGGFDLVNAHRGGGHLAAALALRGRARVPLVRTRGDIRSPRRHALSRLLYARWTDRVIVSGEFMRADYAPLGVAPGRVATIRGGLDLSEYRPSPDRRSARRALGLPEDGPVAGIVARLSPVKGHADFLEAAAIVSKEVPGARFVIAGGEHQVRLSDLESRARRLGIAGAVHYVGGVDDVRPVLAALDVGVVASRGSEAICRIGLEYLACGVPLVATRVGVLPEIVEECVNGHLVSPADPAEMAAAVVRVLSDAEAARRLGEGARRSAEARFGLERFLEETEAVYREVLRG